MEFVGVLLGGILEMLLRFWGCWRFAICLAIAIGLIVLLHAIIPWDWLFAVLAIAVALGGLLAGVHWHATAGTMLARRRGKSEGEG